jgi:arylsulfatase A-like enzyme
MSASPRIRDIALAALACSTVAAGVEVAVAAFRQLILHRITFLSFDFPWMAPFASAVLAVPVTVLAALLSRAVRKPLSLSSLVGLLTGVLVFSLLLPSTAIAWWASATVGVGAGLQIARTLRDVPTARWLAWARVIVVTLLASLAGAGLARRSIRMIREQQIAAALPTATVGAPNVLLIVLDTVRAANLSLYGYGRPTTPVLTALAAESSVFDFAVSTTSWSLPSHGSMFTGRAAGELGGDWLRPIGTSSVTLAEALAGVGYATGGFTANLVYTSYESGLDRGFARYDDYRVSWPMILRHSSLWRIDAKSNLPQASTLRAAWEGLIGTHFEAATLGRKPADIKRSAQDIASAFLGWQAEQSSRPFFAFLNLFDAHGPYYAPQPFLSGFRNGGSNPDVQKYDRYDAAIAWEDSVVGGVLATLRQRGVLDRTIVVVTADHGQLFGEHGLQGHSNGLYWHHLNVPLLIRYPGRVPAGERINALVSLKDLPATVLDLASVENPGIGGMSLASAWSGAQTVPRGALAELSQGINVPAMFKNSAGGMVSWLDDRLHFIRDGAGREELYAYRNDPGEEQDLASAPAFAADLNRMRDAALAAARLSRANASTR